VIVGPRFPSFSRVYFAAMMDTPGSGVGTGRAAIRTARVATVAQAAE
jgi:hypothetical protein